MNIYYAHLKSTCLIFLTLRIQYVKGSGFHQIDSRSCLSLLTFFFLHTEGELVTPTPSYLCSRRLKLLQQPKWYILLRRKAHSNSKVPNSLSLSYFKLILGVNSS